MQGDLFIQPLRNKSENFAGARKRGSDRGATGLKTMPGPRNRNATSGNQAGDHEHNCAKTFPERKDATAGNQDGVPNEAPPLLIPDP
jgi:hypothetical protein